MAFLLPFRIFYFIVSLQKDPNNASFYTIEKAYDI